METTINNSTKTLKSNNILKVIFKQSSSSDDPLASRKAIEEKIRASVGHPRRVSNILLNNTQPSLDELVKISQILCTSIEDLIVVE